MAPKHAVHHGEKNMKQQSNSHHGEQKKGKSPKTFPSNLLLPVRTTPCLSPLPDSGATIVMNPLRD